MMRTKNDQIVVIRGFEAFDGCNFSKMMWKALAVYLIKHRIINCGLGMKRVPKCVNKGLDTEWV